MMKFSLDSTFWIGFAAGAIFAWLTVALVPIYRKISEKVKSSYESVKTDFSTSVGERFRMDVVRIAQQSHLAAPLFSLDEIIQPPTLLAPPVMVVPDQVLPSDDIVRIAVPYMPDWPELASIFKGQRMHPAEAFRKGANVALIGRPGSGKSTTIHYLAYQIAKRRPETHDWNYMSPIIVQAADIIIGEKTDDILDVFSSALASKVSSMVEARLKELIKVLFEEGSAFLMVDGLDELSSGERGAIVAFLEEFLKEYPENKLLVTLPLEDLAAIEYLHLFPVAMAGWTRDESIEFIQRWGEQWKQVVEPEGWAGSLPKMIQTDIINGWLETQLHIPTPLEITLRLWSAYAGDALGVGSLEDLEAYVRRMTVNIPNGQNAAEILAMQVIQSGQTIFTQSEAGRYIDMLEVDESLSEASEEGESERNISTRNVKRLIPALMESDILTSRQANRVNFCHPVICGYAAARGFSKKGIPNDLLASNGFPAKDCTLEMLTGMINALPVVKAWFSMTDKTLTKERVFKAGRWLRYAPLDAPWRLQVLRYLAGIINDENQATGIRARALSAVIQQKDPSLNSLFTQLMSSESPVNRQLGTLGAGSLRDIKMIPALENAMDDRYRTVCNAAALALININDKNSLDALGNALLHGNEVTQRAAAEGLSMDRKVGHEMLEESLGMENLLVRRAAVYGLRRIQEPWTIEKLQTLQIEDKEWIVRNAAGEALESLEALPSYIPGKVLPIHKIPWIVAYASEKGMGVPADERAWNVMRSILEDGTLDQKIAVLQYYALHPQMMSEAREMIENLALDSNQEIKEAAVSTLWFLSHSQTF